MTDQTQDKRPSWKRLVLYNFVVFVMLGTFLYWLIPIVGAIELFARYSGLAGINRKVPAAYAAADHEWVRKFWLENDRTKSTYRSYVGWRGLPSQGETITIAGHYGQRHTVQAAAPSDTKVYFFGGSTMWGSGVDDARTIPSYFAKLSGMHTENFGERAWVAHQSLVLLMQLLQAGHRPDVVVFYDGVNEPVQKCTTGTGADAHGREGQFQTNLNRGARPYYFEHYFAPLVAIAENVKQGMRSQRGWYDCSEDEAKAKAVADALIRDWDFARQLVEWHGGKFIGILQPVIYFTGARRDGRPPPAPDGIRSKSDEHQYRAIYPKLRAEIARGGTYHDFVEALDSHQNVYYDWAHLVPAGNEHIARRIFEIVAPRRADLPQ
jgi:hypothetical protein